MPGWRASFGKNMENALCNIHDVCDYIIVKLDEGGELLNHLKLQKLLYYTQAWHLAFEGTPLFKGKFQAWVHGPVSREIYDRFKDSKSLYTAVTRDDVRKEFDLDSLNHDAQLHIDEVLDSYAAFSGSELESMTHEEKPWIVARDGYKSADRCEVSIDESVMADFYRSRLKD